MNVEHEISILHNSADDHSRMFEATKKAIESLGGAIQEIHEGLVAAGGRETTAAEAFSKLAELVLGIAGDVSTLKERVAALEAR